MILSNEQRLMLLMIVLGLFIFGPSSLQAAEPGPRSCAYKGKSEGVFKKLNLSKEQQAEIKNVQEANRQKAKELRQELKEKRKALGEELDQQKSDPEKIKVLVSDLKDIEGRLIDQRVNGVLKMKEILTPEQYKLFSDTFKKRYKEGMERKRRWQ